MKSSMIIISLLALGILASAYDPSVGGKRPLPNARVKTNEVFNVDLSQYFFGFNITYTTNNSNATVTPPLVTLAAGPFGPSVLTDTPVIIFQAYPRDSSGNIDYSGYILYLTDDAYLYWGNISNYTSAPQMVFGFQVTNLKYVHCYGAAQISKDLIIVDCASTNTTSGAQTDQFYYVSISQQAVVATFNNSATAKTTYNSTTGKATRGVRSADFGNGNQYIFRYVGSDALLEPSLQNGSYVEVYNATNWTQPQTTALISSISLGVPTLNIVAFKLLNSGLFILDSSGIIFNIQNYQVNFNASITNTFSLPSNFTPLGITLGVEYYQTVPKLTVLVYTSSLIWEIDWTVPSSPTVVQNYTFPSDITVLKADYSSSYVVAHVLSPSLGASVVSFDRGSSGFNQSNKYIPVTNLSSVIWWSLDRAYNNLYLWDANASVVHNFHYQKRWLLFNSSSLGDGVVNLNATSYGTGGSTANLIALFSYLVIDSNNFTAYLNTSTINITLDYPSSFSIGIDSAVSGPGINYTVNTPSPLPSYSFQNYGNLNVTLPPSFNATVVYYHKIAANTSAPGTFNWLVQADGYNLYNLWCVDSLNQTTQTPSLNCSLVGTLNLSAQISSLVITPQYIAVITSDLLSNVTFLQPNLTAFANISTGDAIINACADLVLIPSGSYIACSQTISKRIVLWNASHPSRSNQYIINRTNVPQSSIPNFSPRNLVVNNAYPDYLFVRNDVGVLVIDTVLIASLCTVKVITNIVLPAIYLSPPNFDFFINGNSLLLFLYQGNQTLLQEYALNADPTNPLLLKQYSQFYNYTFQSGSASHYSSAVTNRFFTVVQDSQTTPQILAFQSGRRANDNYLHKFALGWNDPAALLSGAHSTIIGAEYLLVGNGNGQLAFFVVFDRTTFSFNSYLDNTGSTTESSSFSLTASSELEPTPAVNVSFSVLTFNSNPPITPGRLANDSNALNFINFTTNRTSFVFNPSDFFNGVITSYTLTPQNTNESNKITLTVPVGPPSTAFGASLQILDLTITDQYVYAQAPSTLFQLNASNLSSVLNIIDMTVPNITITNQRCEGVLADNGWNYSTSFCRDTAKNLGYFITVSDLSSIPALLPVVPTPFTTVTCMRNIGTFVLALENPNGQIINPGAKLHVYNFTNPAQPTYNGYLGGSFFNTTSFQVGRWDIVSLSLNYYRIYLVDARFGVRTVEWNATSGQFSNPLSYNILNDPTFQKDNFPVSASLIGISVLQFNASVSNDSYIALTTDTYNNYYVKLSFSASSINFTLLSVYKKLTAAVNLPKITKASQGFTYFAVSSYNNNTSEGFVNIYNATGTDQASLIKTLPYQPAAEGNIAFTFLTQPNAIKFWAYNPSVTRGLLAQSAGSIQEYQITPFFSINVAPNASITSKYVNLTGSNNHSSTTITFNITYSPTPTPQSSSKWWIWLIVVFALLLFAGAIFAFIRYRKKKQEEVSNDADAPLITNYA